MESGGAGARWRALARARRGRWGFAYLHQAVPRGPGPGRYDAR